MESRQRIRAIDLKHNEIQLREIDKWISDILDAIDDEIKDKHNEGHFSVEYSLQSSFDIPNMTSNKARNKIHSYVISDLASDDRGFIVHYFKKNNKYWINIKWLSLEDQYKINQEKDILAYYNTPVEERVSANKPMTERYAGLRSLVIGEF